ncbi:MAG: DUF4012 domain-containing protein [Acidimicrobiales bacterium]
MSRRMRRLLVATGALVLLGSLIVVTGLQVAGVSADLQDANDLVDEAAVALRDGRLADATAALGEAQDLVFSSNETLRSSIGLGLLRMVPGAGANLHSLQESVDLAAVVIHGGLRILDLSEPLQSDQGTLEVSLSDGTVPIDAVTGAQREISHLLIQLSEARRSASSGLLLPPVAEARDAVLGEAAGREQQLGVLNRGLDLLGHLAGADGPRRYLIAVANTAEMRGSGGMILNYGVLEGRDGVIDLVEFGDIDELAVPGPVSTELLPDDYLARWGGFDALSRFRQANLAGDFTVVAPVLEALYTSASGLPVNGVLQVDPDGLAAILAGVGPVVVPELGEVRSDNVVDLTLNEAYFLFPDVEARTDVLGDVAEAAFRRLVDGDFPSLRPLAEALVDAVDGRHLLMWADRSGAQSAIEAFGADGAYPPVEEVDGASDAFALTAQNLAGNKLDYYLDTELRLSGDRAAGALGEVEAEITLTNTAPADVTVPAYIFGPGPGEAQLPAGTLRSLVTLYLPVGASLQGSGGDVTVEPVSSGTEAGRPYASFIVDLAAGEARTVALSLQLAPRPPGDYEVVLIPSPRIRPTSVAVDLTTEAGAVQGSVELDRQWVLAPATEPTAAVGPVFR